MCLAKRPFFFNPKSKLDVARVHRLARGGSIGRSDVALGHSQTEAATQVQILPVALGVTLTKMLASVGRE